MLSDGNQTDGNSLERFLTPYQNSRLPLNSRGHSQTMKSIINIVFPLLLTAVIG